MTYRICYYDKKDELTSYEFDIFETEELALKHLKEHADSNPDGPRHYVIVKSRQDLIVTPWGTVVERIKDIIVSKKTETRLREWWPNRADMET